MPRKDPRLPAPDRTANEILLDRAIRHALYLERLKTGEAQRVLRFLDGEVFPDLVDRLRSRLDRIASRGFDRGPWTTKRYADLVSGLRSILTESVGVLQSDLSKRLASIGRAEATWQASVIGSASPIAFDLDLPGPATIRSIVTSQPFQGVRGVGALSEHLGAMSQATVRAFDSQVKLGLIEGETTEQIVRRIRGSQTANGLLRFTRNEAQTLVRTAVNHVSSRTRETTYKDNSDVVKGVQWVSTLDGRTTLVCQDRDSNVYDVNEGPRPPAHPGCRSTTTPVLKSWKELGVNLAEAPEGTRASMDGQVPASLTYREWLRGQPFEVQKEALGTTRARLFRSGKLSIDKFVDRTGRSLSLEEIAQREGIEIPALA